MFVHWIVVGIALQAGGLAQAERLIKQRDASGQDNAEALASINLRIKQEELKIKEAQKGQARRGDLACRFWYRARHHRRVSQPDVGVE
jgi:hypothetical protein